MKPTRRDWKLVVFVATPIALISLATNLTSSAEMSGGVREWAYIRRNLTKLTNSETVWAGLGIGAGWQVKQFRWAPVAAALACEIALVVQYAARNDAGCGRLLRGSGK